MPGKPAPVITRKMGILLMTGYADQLERASGLNALIHDVITKPFSLGTIRSAVNEALAACREKMHWNERTANERAALAARP